MAGVPEELLRLSRKLNQEISLKKYFACYEEYREQEYE